MDQVGRPPENSEFGPARPDRGSAQLAGDPVGLAEPGRRSPRTRTAVAQLLLRARLSPNAVTIIGTLGVVAAALGFAARGELLTATVLGTIFGYCDLVDGEMARIGKRASTFGALLDSVLDRVADGAIFGSLAYWLLTSGEHRAGLAALICLVAGLSVPYVRARAEGLGLVGETGIAPRLVRLELIVAGGLLGGFGVPHGLEIVLWILAVLSTVTVWQRISFVRHQLRALETDLA